MNLPPLTMRVHPLGYGRRCHACKQPGDIISFELWRGDSLIRNVQICKKCVGAADIEAKAELHEPASPTRSKQAKERVKRSRRLEQDLARRVGGRAQPASGSSRLAGFRGDVRKVGSWRMEHKFTDALKTYALHLGDLSKIVGMAAEAGEYPALVLEFTRVRESFAILPLALFLEMINADDQDRTPPKRRPKRR
jgi:hypothetical protein